MLLLFHDLEVRKPDYFLNAAGSNAARIANLESALSDALEKIDDVDEETFRDAKSIIELLKENLSLWKEEEEQNAVEDL